MGKIRERLWDLIRTPGRKIVQYVRGDLADKLDELQGEMRQVKERVKELQERLEDLAAKRGDKTAAAAQKEGEEGGVTGRTVRAIREEYELSRDELAELLEVSPKTVSSWENGRSTPRADNRTKIANLREKGKGEVDEALGRVQAGPPFEPGEIVELRRQFGLTQKELAQLLDVSSATIWTPSEKG